MRRKWTEEEEDFLINNWHKKGATWCANKLKRSYKSVSSKAICLRLGGFISSSGYLTRNNIADFLGINKNVVQRWLNNGLIKHELAASKMKAYSVKISDLEHFLKNNQDLWDSRYIKISLWRTKPDWLKEKIQKDKICPPKINKPKMWSKREERLLLDMFEKTQYTYKQMAEVLARHPRGVKSKLWRLQKAKLRR